MNLPFPYNNFFELPLLDSQESLWTDIQLNHNNYPLHTTIRLDFSRLIDREELHKALKTLIIRHDNLRATIRLIDGVPKQVINPVIIPELRMITLDCKNNNAHLNTLLRQCAAEPFNLETGPLFRAWLFNHQENCTLLLVAHPLIADGESCTILGEQLLALLDDTCKMQKDAGTGRYIKFVEAQQSHNISHSLRYWQTELNPLQIPPPLMGSTLRQPSPRRGKTRTIIKDMGVEPYQALTHAAGKDTTPFMIHVALCSILSSRYCAQSQGAVGVPFSLRPPDSTLTGMLVNILPLAYTINNRQSFLDNLDQVRLNLSRAMMHAHVPYQKILNTLSLDKPTTHGPFFQVCVNHLRLPSIQLGATSLERSISIENVSVAFDLSLTLVEDPITKKIIFEYDEQVFEADFIIRLASHYRVLLQQAAHKPNALLQDLQWLATAERKQLLHAWNATAQDIMPTKGVHTYFEQQVMRTPHAVAIRMEEQELSYAVLNVRANQLAHQLRKWGVGPDVLVGVCVTRSIEMVIALLAVLKAGGAYVPLDPEYPLARLTWMLEDIAAPVILTQSWLINTLPTRNVHTLALDVAWLQELKDAPHHNPGVTLQPGHLAYCIYTSGSTGRPKGVLVSHEAICNLLHDMQNGLDLQPTDILLSIAPATFDIFGLDFYLPLTTGTVLLLANPKQVKDPVAITRLCDIHRVTILQATPSAWRMLKDGKFNAPLKFALSSGETMGQDIAKWLPHVAKHVWNLYGPTETTIWSSKVLRSDADSAITIGKPITNTRLYILDQQLNPVPVGVPGELYIAGAGLARGYLKQPGQTAERFIPDPYGPAGSRMYRTGDRTKYLPNGEIDYIGRLDRQVKIRGFRIETGEIEAALLTNGLCRNAVLMTHVWGENPQLVAYVVPGTANQPNEFRAALKRTLPDYMIPTVWVLLSTLPLNTNGKIDYKALPAPERPVTDITAPRTLTEKRVAKVWGEVLEVDQVGIHDNFFALWGHSLLATKIAAQLSQIFGQTLSMRMLFDFPTIAELSNMLDKTCGEALGTTPVHTIQRQARIPCQHPLPTKK